MNQLIIKATDSMLFSQGKNPSVCQCTDCMLTLITLCTLIDYSQLWFTKLQQNSLELIFSTQRQINVTIYLEIVYKKDNVISNNSKNNICFRQISINLAFILRNLYSNMTPNPAGEC